MRKIVPHPRSVRKTLRRRIGSSERRRDFIWSPPPGAATLIARFRPSPDSGNRRAVMRTTTPRLVFTLCVLLAINTMNFFDRQILPAVQEKIRKEWNLSDSELGLLG